MCTMKCNLCHAVPTYGQGGEIIDGGADLTLPGVTGYSFDIIYLCILVQLVTIVTNWGWLIFLLVCLSAISRESVDY